MRTLRCHADFVRSVAFSPNGKLIVSGSDDKLVMIHNAATGEKVIKPRGVRGGVQKDAGVLCLGELQGIVPFEVV